MDNNSNQQQTVQSPLQPQPIEPVSSIQPDQQPPAESQSFIPPAHDSLHIVRLIIIVLFVILLTASIGAGGYFLGVKKNQPITQAPTPTLVQPTPTPNPTANWKTYTSQKYKFSFKQPNLKECCKISGPAGAADLIVTLAESLTVEESSGKPFNGLAVYVVSRDVTGEEFNSYIFYQKGALLEMSKAFTGEESKSSGIEANIIVAGRQGVSLKGFSWDDIERLYVPFPDNQKMLVIARSQTSTGSFDNVFNQILSTFKFTN